MRDVGEHKTADNPVNFMAFKVADAEKEVKAAAEEDIDMGSNGAGAGAGGSSSSTTTKPAGQRSSSAGAFTFEFPPSASASASASASGSSSHSSMSNGSSTPHRRRSAAPTSIPNFPSNNQPRDSPFSPSPTESPAANTRGGMFPSPSPSATPPQAPSLGRLPAPSFPMNGGGGGMPSPWHMLAATSGAPTPSIDGPGMGRNSPHLGSPFEKLNIGGSWSGANLDQASASASNRRASLEPPAMSLGLSTSPGKSFSFEPPSSMGFQFGGAGGSNGVKSPLGGEPLGAGASGSGSDSMAVDPPEPSTSKKPPLPPTLAMRRASLPKNHVNVHGPVIGKSSSPLATTPSPGPSTKPKALIVGQMKSVLAKPATLILDLRPPSSFQASHIPDAHSLPIPSTLLRRPAFTIQKLTQMLSAASMEAVSHWRETSDIVMVDQDSGAVPDGSVLDGLAGKFAREGYSGQMWFVKGGHRAIQSSGAQLVGGDSGADTPIMDAADKTAGGLMAGGMGRLAFQQNSTGGGPNSPSASMRSNLAETPSLAFRLNPFDKVASPGSKGSPGGRSHTHSNSGSSGRRVSFQGAIDCSSSNGSNLQPANPFFDNIRQNLELSHGGITERIPLKLPPDVSARAEELPPFLRDLVTMSEKEGADKLANQFYELELGEQRRLQSVMNWHTQDSGATLNGSTAREHQTQQSKDREEVDRLAAWGTAQRLNPGPQSPSVSGDPDDSDAQSNYFPFSITAGVERGTKNRYKNIWPYDFSRVRLGAPAEDSDYINASYVQPRGTTRRYIATQGPLDATYCDFWTLIWEQDVRVIVMITKQFEGGSIKCGNYWEDQQYGPVRLKLVSQTGGEDKTYKPTTGFDFGPAASTTPQDNDDSDKPVSHIKRVFSVTHKDHPDAPAREVVQIQCVSWPDFDVPHSADVLLSLIREADASFCRSFGIRQDSDRQEEPPVLVHCSAGVGRTGSFIVVDAILDGLRREYQLTPMASVLPEAPGSGPGPGPGSSAATRSRPSSSRASSGEKQHQLAQPQPVPAQALVQDAIPEMSEGRAQATDQQYKTESFQKHRHRVGTSITSSGSDLHGLRPAMSLASGSDQSHSKRSVKSEKMSEIERSIEMPQPVTASGTRHRSPTPLSAMDNPVWEVLEGMRVQRMSLVQSLRQYVFVYRAIITAYIQMLDAAQDPRVSIPNSTSEDDVHSKRRASPTELVPEPNEHGVNVHPDTILGAGDGIGGEGGAASLVKRPSFKKMRSSAVEGISLASRPPSSPKKAQVQPQSKA